MSTACIVSTGSYLPGDPLTNQDLEALAGPLPEDILTGLQVETRHWMVDPATGEHRESNSGMAFNAANQALDRAGLAAAEVDLIVTSTSSPEYLLPPMAVFLQDKLGLKACASIEVRSGCAGAVEALDIARLYIERGMYQTALVVGSEAISPLLVPIFRGKDPSAVRMRDRLGLYSFGDGAGAIVLRASSDDRGIVGSSMACLGGGKNPGMQVVGGGTHAPLHKQAAAQRLIDLKVDVVESGKFTPYVLTQALTATLQRSRVAAGSIDLCIIPEGNAGYVTEELRAAGLLTPEWTALESKIFENLSIVGATGSAAVPLALDFAWTSGRLKQGDEVMLLAIETSKWIYAGMVLTWTAAER